MDDWTAFAKATKLKAAALKKVRPFITEKDLTAKPIDGEPDTELRDTEIVPFLYKGGIDGFIRIEVLPYTPDAWVDEKKTAIGYEINFARYFFEEIELRPMEVIIADLKKIEEETAGLISEITGGNMQ